MVPTRQRLSVIVGIGIVCFLAELAVGRFIRHEIQLRTYSPDVPRVEINAPFIKSSDCVVEAMVEAAQLRDDMVVYDLGCGDGRIVISAALHSGCRGIGFDIDSNRVAEARENVALHGVSKRVRIVQQDIFTVDLRKADVVMAYLLPWMMNKLRAQFEQMRPGCRIVSHDMWIDQVAVDKIISVPTDEQGAPHMVFVYTTPLVPDPAMPRGAPPRQARNEAPQ